MIMNKIKKLLLCSFNLQYFKAYLNLVCPLFELSSLLKFTNNVKTIIDIGSNKGQFSILARSFFPKAKIYSFEPQKKYLDIQKKILSKNKINYFNVGLGNKKSKKKFYITQREDSSSFLKPSNLDLNEYEIKNIRNVQLDRLDNIIKSHNIKKPALIKLDVQGFELEALKGAIKILKNIDYIITEISYKKIYHNQVSKKKLIKFLKKNHFSMKKITNITKLDNGLFQADYLYKRINKKI